jgi:hypothetical protein
MRFSSLLLSRIAPASTAEITADDYEMLADSQGRERAD